VSTLLSSNSISAALVTSFQQSKELTKKGRSPALPLILRSSIKTGLEYVLLARSHTLYIQYRAATVLPSFNFRCTGNNESRENHFLRITYWWNHHALPHRLITIQARERFYLATFATASISINVSGVASDATPKPVNAGRDVPNVLAIRGTMVSI
jgi:hypothetical protein